MKVTVLGAAKEVGRSAFLIDTNNAKILLDYGVMLRRKEPLFPIHVKPKDIDAVVITHAHLDHSGFVPSLFLSKDITTYSTQPTLELSSLLIEDMIRISGFYLPFEYIDLIAMQKSSRSTSYREPFSLNDTTVVFHESGHVVGGSTVVVEYDNKRIFYTGDINTKGTKMMRAMDLDIGDIDLIITESTYAMEDHQPRKEAEKKLIDFANEVVERRGILFVPAFSVERAQEIACIFKEANFKHNIVMDGMALKVNKIISKHPDFLRDPKLFSDAIRKTEWVSGWKDRRRIVKEPCVVISPAGMLVGGAGVYYLQQIAQNERNGIAMVSYQGEGTPGKELLEKRVATIEGKVRKVTAEIQQFEFSGHSGRSDLFEMISQIKGNPKVLTVHGDGESCIKFAKDIHEKFGLEAYAPNTGETVTV
ncbi:MAG: MBL fold metallo-hydrolase [Thaumarchaeota archaeon]|nr:MBL fold metallo-hydrolase [Nitrososphaerota archaeon]